MWGSSNASTKFWSSSRRTRATPMPMPDPAPAPWACRSSWKRATDGARQLSEGACWSRTFDLGMTDLRNAVLASVLLLDLELTHLPRRLSEEGHRLQPAVRGLPGGGIQSQSRSTSFRPITAPTQLHRRQGAVREQDVCANPELGGRFSETGIRHLLTAAAKGQTAAPVVNDPLGVRQIMLRPLTC